MNNRAHPSRWLIGALVAVFALATAGQADAKRKRRKGKPYIFELWKIDLRKGVPAHVKEPVRKQVGVAIEAHDQLVAEADDAAPDPHKQPAKYKKYLKRNKQRAFRVNVEVTSYTHELEEDEGIRRLKVSVELRMFGETIPDRVMAFAGDGAATIKIDIGKKLRDRDTEYANSEAIKLAVEEAIATSIKKLKATKKKKWRKKRRKKK